MKTGKPTRLSEKLTAELDLIRAEHIASMQSQLENFRTDLNSIATNAQRTIETDTQRFIALCQSMFTTRLTALKRRLRASPWIIAGVILAAVALMMALSWLWVAILNQSELNELGLTRIDQDGTWLILDPTKTRLRTCTMGGRSVTCIKIEEN